MARHIHIVWAPATGPLDAYWNPSQAQSHAMAMLGVELSSLEVACSSPDRPMHVFVACFPNIGPVAAYDSIDDGETGSSYVAKLEVRTRLPSIISDDLVTDFDGDDDTPIDVEEIDDANR